MPEDVAKEFLGAPAVEEMRLVGGALVGVAGRDRDAVDAHLGHRVEKPRDPLGFGRIEQRRVAVDPEAARLGEPDRFARALVDEAKAYRAVVVLLVAVEMYGPGKKRIMQELVN